MVVENRETLDSFAVITSELRTLEQNLESTAIELEDKLKEKQREEAELRELEIAKVHAKAAYEAEMKKFEVPILNEEPKKILNVKTESPVTHSSTLITEHKEERVVEETVTSAVTTKEIHILQKVRDELL